MLYKNGRKIYTSENGRKIIRLQGYDYSQAGLYFITICCQERAHLFGEVVEGEMVLNDAGKMIEKWYFEMENKFPDLKCHEMVVMPNHFHCLLEKTRDEGTTKFGSPTTPTFGSPTQGRPCVGDPNIRVDTPNMNTPNIGPITPQHIIDSKSQYGPDNIKYGASIPEIMMWFKTMTTNEYIRGVKTLNWKRFNQRVWQRSYDDRIIRNQQHLYHVINYIKNNPKNWPKDNLNPD